MRKKKRALVGVDQGERREQGQGRKERGVMVARMRSTHGRGGSLAKGVEVSTSRAVPMKSGLEVSHRMVAREGEFRDTQRGIGMGGSGALLVGEAPQKGLEKEVVTRRDGGRRVGWETRRVPNRYDYYLEGHIVTRASKARAQSSRASEVDNFIG